MHILQKSALVATLLTAQSALPQEQHLIGFTSIHAQQQLDLEKQFDSKLNKENPRNWLKRLSAKPHQVGSNYGLQNAEFMLGLFKSWGYDAQIERFYVLFPTPKKRLLELTGARRFRASLTEPELKEDSTSAHTAELLPPYNAYSADGNVTAKLVYANYGMPKDYETLASKGIDVKGRIVIARYGGGWRGLKPKLAYEHGAIGCLIYSDPKDDGYYQGEVYPKGPFRNEHGVQRGSVADMPIQPGDPLTPGYGAVKDAPRIAIKDAKTIMKIPVTAISYGDALPLMKDLGGPVAPDDWRGALPITYHMGPGTSDCHLQLEFNWNTVEARDVIAKLPGADLPDEWLIRGNHHDGWVTGAQDPLSGTVALLEEARGVSELVKTGWKPKRTMIYCCWDGEEPGLLGSTEWVETHFDELSKKAAVYINSDTNGRGYLGMEGSHSLESFVNEVARAVPDPEYPTISVGQRTKDRKIVAAPVAERKKLIDQADVEIGALGSGSDFTPFLQHVGIATLSLEYGGESRGGIYHSAYDSFDWYTRFDDTTFDYELSLSKTVGRAMLRLADADVLPFRFTHLAERINTYVGELTKLVDTMREETASTNLLLANGTIAPTLDPHEPNVLQKPKDPVPAISFDALKKSATHLLETAKAYDAAQAAGSEKEAPKELDAIVIGTERALLSPEGLPGRPWYKHMIYAPGLNTGYGVKTLPGVREALEERNWQLAQNQLKVLSPILDQCAAQIEKATALFAK